MKILILSTVHRWNDPRVFHKQARTLAREHEVILAAVDEGPPRLIDGVQLRPLGVWNTRFDRPKIWLRAYREILGCRPRAIHFHDPELTLVLLPLVLTRCLLICDVHEHPRAAIAGRQWIPRPLRRMVAGFFSRLLRTGPYLWDRVILAEASYQGDFPARTNVRLIRNWALIPNPDVPLSDRYLAFDPARDLRLIYTGSITRDRGALVMLNLLDLLAQRFPGVRLDLVGKIRPPALEESLRQKAEASQGRLRLHGYLDLSQMAPLIARAHLGLIPLQPHPNFEGSLSTKFFDYMTYGLPCVASDFPLWRKFFEENPGGVTADCTRPEVLAEVIIALVGSPLRLRDLSLNGFQLVRERFNWNSEGEKLLRMYREFSARR